THIPSAHNPETRPQATTPLLKSADNQVRCSSIVAARLRENGDELRGAQRFSRGVFGDALETGDLAGQFLVDVAGGFFRGPFSQNDQIQIVSTDRERMFQAVA